MANELYNELNPSNSNPMLNKLLEFKNNLNGDPEQIVKNLLNSGKVSQAQINQYAQQANQIYKAMGNLLK